MKLMTKTKEVFSQSQLSLLLQLLESDVWGIGFLIFDIVLTFICN